MPLQGLEFDNANHPSYQSQQIDESEEGFRRQDRCVYEADASETGPLMERLRLLVPPQVVVTAPAEYEHVCWHLHGINEMFR